MTNQLEINLQTESSLWTGSARKNEMVVRSAAPRVWR